MVDHNESVMDILKSIQSLRSFLKSEIYISESDEGASVARIKVYNDAPESNDGSNVIFLGVGLRFINSTEDEKVRHSAYTPSEIRKFRPTDRIYLREQYNEGIWLTSPFPDLTEDEISHGEALFPGETVAYEFKIPDGDLPYLDIRVEGSVSRRHLLHTSQSIGPQNPQKNKEIDIVGLDYNQINQWFNAVDKIDFSAPLIAIANEVSDLGPHTTLADIEKLKALIDRGLSHIKEVREEM